MESGKLESILDRYTDAHMKKGERYAMATFLASMFFAGAITESVEDTIEIIEKYRDKIPDQYIQDALNILQIETDDMSVWEAADIYFKGVEK